MSGKKLTGPQRELLARVRTEGPLVFNDRARSRIEALEQAGLVTADWDADLDEQKGRLRWRITVTAVPQHTTPGWKLFVWEGVLAESYSSGMIVAIARSLDHAIKVARDQGEMSTVLHDMASADPQVIELGSRKQEPEIWTVWGGC